MSVKIIATQDFARRLKKLIKKYKSLKDEMAMLVDKDNRLFLLTIYDKSDTETIRKEEILQMIKKIE